MNITILTGRVGNFPNVTTLKNNKKRIEFILFFESNWLKEKDSDKRKSNHFYCRAYGKTAEFLATSITKGSPILVEGELDIDMYESNGQKKIASYVLISRFQRMENAENHQKRIERNNQKQIEPIQQTDLFEPVQTIEMNYAESFRVDDLMNEEEWWQNVESSMET